ncbi:MAG TPA: DUF6515 family protein [Gammaproteobacteria bacterium]|jgi:hypothetical protein|nr:DUF6515 family protein [Gammaproteobacteria bacterium]
MPSRTLIVAVAALATTGAWLATAGDAAAQPPPPHHGQLRHAPPIGAKVRVLPGGHETVRVGRTYYHYRDGVFYRPFGPDRFVVVGAPIGARIRVLPFGAVSFYIGPRRYFYANYTYYWWDPRVSEYVVVSEPPGAEKAVADASEAGSGEIFVYPKEGQTDEQRDRDRYDCHLWAVNQTGFDPSAGVADTGKSGDYRRALAACLEGRGYTVK